MKITIALIGFATFIIMTETISAKSPLFMDVVKIRAVSGRDAIIPCGQKKIFLDGAEAYVAWMKNDREIIYRFPLSNGNEDGYTTSNEICYKDPETGPCRERTSLFLPRVTNVDSGEYRCRIHYQASPSIDYSFELIIVDKPGFPTVYDEDGNTMTNTFIGPIPLGANVTLICEVKDDRPSTVVYWEKEGDLFVPSVSIGPGLRRTILRIINASRNEHESRYSCISQAGDVTDPLKNTLEIRMYLPPLSITINLNERQDFEAGNPRVVDCIVIGSVPTPTIEWYLDNNRLKIYSHKESPGFNVTLSTMTFTPKRSDDNRILSCRAKNPYFKNEFTSSVRLTVGYKPVCAQTLKQKLNIKSNKIEKVICLVDADPPPVVFNWNFSNFKSVETPVEATDVPFRFKSVLSWIPHDEDIGKLGCSAVNHHGKQVDPCYFDLHNKALDTCPPDQQGEDCKNGGLSIVSGPPKKTGYSIAGNNQQGDQGEFQFSMVWKEVISGVVFFCFLLFFTLVLCHKCCNKQEKIRRSPNDSRDAFEMEEEESTTYYRSAEPGEQTCPIHSSSIHRHGASSGRPSAPGTSLRGGVAPPAPSRASPSPLFDTCDIQSFYV